MKRQIRQQIREALAAMDPMTRYARSLAACKHLTCTETFRRADVVMIYLSMADEVDTAAIALAGWQAGKTIAAPSISWEHHRLTPIEIASLEAGVVPGRHGVPEPPAHGQPVPIEMIDLVVVPGLAFDRRGRRLGRGGGFYDRFLSHPECVATTFGLAFHEQVVDELACEDHDHPVDHLATDEKVYDFRSSGRTAASGPTTA
ncbi:MAG: 5-formyltetrahydrofolate cyclo-ligase [Planctomycetes bacterium]|nr:5-formyltetrahydrofolate cyclo-ligase [Planctomycetota bacterium]